MIPCCRVLQEVEYVAVVNKVNAEIGPQKWLPWKGDSCKAKFSLHCCLFDGFCSLKLLVICNYRNFLNIRTPKKFVIITLKFELCGSTIE